MGFWFSYEDITHKQRVNVSASAWLTIEEDIDLFGNGAKRNVAGFLNRIFANYYHEADASISERLIDKNGELSTLFSSPEFKSMDKEVTGKYITAIQSVYEQQLIEKINSYEKGHSENFNINKSNVEILSQSANDRYYDGNIGKYLRAIYEEYSRKPMFEREQIYFKSIVDDINSAISQRKKLKISLLPKLKVNGRDSYVRRFYLAPMRLLQDKTRSYNYVVGYAEEIQADGVLLPKQISVFRISHLDRVSVMTSMSGFLTAAERETLGKMMSEKEVQFLSGDLMDFKIRFTDKGLEMFNRQLYLRPGNFDVLEESTHTYMFHCTEYQIISYFVKFCRDVEILEPEATRNKFISRYRDAYRVYVKEDSDENVRLLSVQ